MPSEITSPQDQADNQEAAVSAKEIIVYQHGRWIFRPVLDPYMRAQMLCQGYTDQPVSPMLYDGLKRVDLPGDGKHGSQP